MKKCKIKYRKMLDKSVIAVCLISFSLLLAFSQIPQNSRGSNFRHHVIIDADANNEVDDQHAMAYLFFSGDVFAVEGVTVNATSDPRDGVTYSDVSDHYDEAKNE